MSTESPPEAVESAPKILRWCVGKFVYVRGADQPLHFMELKRFVIDDAVDYSHLFYLRGLRARRADGGYLDEALKKWMEGTAVRPLAEAVVHVSGKTRDRLQIGEFFPGVGLTFEYVKLLLESRTTGREAAFAHPVVRYEGYGPAAARNQFLILHQNTGYEIAYMGNTEVLRPESDLSGHILVLNHNQNVRMDEDHGPGLEEFLRLRSHAKVIAMRVTASARDEDYTTVKGRRIKLMSMSRLSDALTKTGQTWYCRHILEFDPGFFLPDACGSTGLAIAYSAPDAGSFNKFQAV